MRYVVDWPFDEKTKMIEKRDYSLIEKECLLRYMKSFEPVLSGGLVYDVVKKQSIDLENVSYEDGEFIWETRDIYHIEKYDEAVSDDFLQHIFQAEYY